MSLKQFFKFLWLPPKSSRYTGFYFTRLDHRLFQKILANLIAFHWLGALDGEIKENTPNGTPPCAIISQHPPVGFDVKRLLQKRTRTILTIAFNNGLYLFACENLFFAESICNFLS